MWIIKICIFCYTYICDIFFIYWLILNVLLYQEEVYEGTTKTLVQDILDGYNATVFAYGATGSGKTHTMIGTSSNPGIMVRALNDIFLAAKKLPDNTEFTVSFLNKKKQFFPIIFFRFLVFLLYIKSVECRFCSISINNLCQQTVSQINISKSAWFLSSYFIDKLYYISASILSTALYARFCIKSVSYISPSKQTVCSMPTDWYQIQSEKCNRFSIICVRIKFMFCR